MCVYICPRKREAKKKYVELIKIQLETFAHQISIYFHDFFFIHQCHVQDNSFNEHKFFFLIINEQGNCVLKCTNMRIVLRIYNNTCMTRYDQIFYDPNTKNCIKIETVFQPTSRLSGSGATRNGKSVEI